VKVGSALGSYVGKVDGFAVGVIVVGPLDGMREGLVVGVKEGTSDGSREVTNVGPVVVADEGNSGPVIVILSLGGIVETISGDGIGIIYKLGEAVDTTTVG
jgi:hypothetical protein